MITEKELYEAPSMEIFEIVNEGIICASGDTLSGASGNDFLDGGFVGGDGRNVWD